MQRNIGADIMKNNALKMNQNDNVVITIRPVKKGSPVVVEKQQLFNTTEDIDLGHKIALVPIASGGKVFRYGEPIVETTRDIKQGEWVHVHNTKPIPAGPR